MQNTVKLLLLTLCTLVGVQGFSQVRNCGAMHYLEQQMQQDPKRATKLEAIERHTQQWQNSGQRVNGVITIPVVVHVLYKSSSENISDAQILSQIQVLNEDFRRTNSDANNTWSQAADTEIEFCLASVDPAGNATNGITRTQTSVSSFGTNDAMKYSSQGGKDAWPTTDYLNMWVCTIGGGILGYAQFPGGSAATDGVVVDSRYFGTTGTATAPFDLGRTTTHEVGHWLNLRHIWGDGNCNADDFVADTPTSDAANYGCATGHVSCSSTDMVENYMDYSDDACMNLYTLGQKNRMRALFDTGGFRESLLSSNGCGNGTTPTCSDGIQNGDETGVDCGGTNCAPCPSSCVYNTVQLSITFDNYPEETSWTLTDNNGQTVASGGTYGNQADGSTLTEELCLEDGCYDFTINDSYGDGICCSYGNGSYSLTGDGQTLASGGSFSSSETTNFCVGGGATPTCTDGIQNGDETGVDCGGSNCPACPTCNDGIQNGDETGVDCGGSNCPACVTCSDGIQNGDETGVDCGGSNCPACITCNDGIQNGDETGVDCGGSNCPACVTCSDGIQNGDETGVDCGGSNCPPCSGSSCTDVVLTITFDNYPEETSWTLTDNNGQTVASGGTYGNQADGSTLTETLCLEDGCYDFTINDSYGDGICCSYGNGSYSLTGDGQTLASGGSFNSSETTNFCVGGGATPTCTDGIQNGDETGVDCGGSNCTPCNGGGCTYATINEEGFEGGWGIWNDGGSDSYRDNTASYANTGTFSIRLRDNTSSSVMTTDNLNLSAYEELTVDFSYIARSMDNASEDFWLQISTNGGSSYTTIEEWNRGDEFQNDIRENDSVVIPGPFTSNTRLRFRCDASGNSDWVYIDDVVITGCTSGGTRLHFPSAVAAATDELVQKPLLHDVSIFPNPSTDMVQIRLTNSNAAPTHLLVTDITGKQCFQSQFGDTQTELNVSTWTPGVYILHLVNGKERVAKKLIVQ